MVSIQEIAKEAKAADELIGTVSHILDRAERSVIIEITNATTRTLTIYRHAHEHGNFSPRATAGQTIGPMQSIVVGSESSDGSIMTGTEGRLWYTLDPEGTSFYMHWNVPFAGSNDCHFNVDGPNRGWYAPWGIISGGSRKVSCKFVVAEHALMGPVDPDWVTCGECKGLVYRLDEHQSKCPGRIDWPDGPPIDIGVNPGEVVIPRQPRYLPHTTVGWVLGVPHGVPGPNREGAWRRCKRCKQLFWDGEEKGACPKWDAPVRPHEADDDSPEFFLPYDMAPRPGQQNDWRWCEKCSVLFYLPQNDDSDCAAGGHHRAHPYNYVLNVVRTT